ALVTLPHHWEYAGKGLPASITDAGVAALMAHAGLEGAIYNVRINLGSIHDKPWVNETRSRLASMLEEANTVATEVRTRVQQGIE
ncbi:MAG: cyclodeaminase/cyclohydrolase family protein, partial [Planctomycetota bacterium]